MEYKELLIKIPEDLYRRITLTNSSFGEDFPIYYAIKNGIILPKEHGDLFDKNEILRFLKCPKYENCDWKNCFDCNQSRCINLNNVNDLVPIISAYKEQIDGNDD